MDRRLPLVVHVLVAPRARLAGQEEVGRDDGAGIGSRRRREEGTGRPRTLGLHRQRRVRIHDSEVRPPAFLMSPRPSARPRRSRRSERPAPRGRPVLRPSSARPAWRGKSRRRPATSATTDMPTCHSSSARFPPNAPRLKTTSPVASDAKPAAASAQLPADRAGRSREPARRDNRHQQAQRGMSGDVGKVEERRRGKGPEVGAVRPKGEEGDEEERAASQRTTRRLSLGPVFYHMAVHRVPVPTVFLIERGPVISLRLAPIFLHSCNFGHHGIIRRFFTSLSWLGEAP